MSRALKVFYGIGFLLSSFISVYFTLAWLGRNQMSYNESGTYFDGLIVWNEQTAEVYAFLALVSFVIALVMAVNLRQVVQNANT